MITNYVLIDYENVQPNALDIRLFGTSRGKQAFYYRIRKPNSCKFLHSIRPKMGRNSFRLSDAEYREKSHGKS